MLPANVKSAAGSRYFTWGCYVAIIIILLMDTVNADGLFDIFDSSDDDYTYGKTKETLECSSFGSVCTSLLKISPNTFIDEGPYCKCPSCGRDWNEYDGKSLTWHHHQRSDWLVQYKFCDEVIPKEVCTGEEVAMKIQSSHNTWNPQLTESTCRCTSGRYFMLGWRDIGSTQWEYSYTCQQKTCRPNDPCVRIYIDDYSSRHRYHYLCGCAEGYSCPANKTFHRDTPRQFDNDGEYALDFCEKNRRPS